MKKTLTNRYSNTSSVEIFFNDLSFGLFENPYTRLAGLDLMRISLNRLGQLPAEKSLHQPVYCQF